MTLDPTGASSAAPRRLVRAEQVLAARTRRVALVLESSQDPHNVHAVMRTAEALGVQEVHLVAPRGEASAISPGVTQRAHEWLDVRRHASVEQAIAHARADGRTIVAADNAPEAIPLSRWSPEGRIALVLGNESEGLSEAARALADATVRIDLVGFSGSLNLSVAAALFLWELRRLDVVSERPGDLTEPELFALRARWYPALLGRRGDDAAVASWLEQAPAIAAEARDAARVPPADRKRP